MPDVAPPYVVEARSSPPAGAADASGGPSDRCAYIQYSPDVFSSDGEVSEESMAAFLRDFMQEFLEHTARVLTVIPRANL